MASDSDSYNQYQKKYDEIYADVAASSEPKKISIEYLVSIGYSFQRINYRHHDFPCLVSPPSPAGVRLEVWIRTKRKQQSDNIKDFVLDGGSANFLNMFCEGSQGPMINRLEDSHQIETIHVALGIPFPKT